MELFKKREKKTKAPKPEKQPKEKRIRKRVSFLEVIASVAVLAIVGTVGFLVYKNHFKKQIPQTDKELVNQLNQSISKHFPKGGNLDLTDVIKGADEDGIVFSKLQFADTNTELIFDSNKNLFGIFENGKGVTYPVDIERKEDKIDPTLWKFAKKNPGDKINPFSYYLLDGCSGKLTVVGGVDVGTNDDIERVTYFNANDIKQTVTLRTNSYETELIVTETVGDTINHYGRLGKLTVNRLHTDSYHEYGDMKYAYIPNGRVVAESGGNIDVAIVTSEVAYVQEKGSGKIGRAFATTERVQNASNKADERHGKKKELEYDTSLSRDKNEERAVIIAEAALNKAIVEERIERGFEKHPHAIGYYREGDTINIFDSFHEAISFFENSTTENEEGFVLNVTGNEVLQEDLIIKDLDITFRGDEENRPLITGNIVIEHSSGKHKVRFENIAFRNTNSNKDTVLDHSQCEGEDKVNNLEFDNCAFSYDSSKISKKSAISLCPVDGYIGTVLTVKNSIFENINQAQYGITTRGVLSSDNSINRGEKILSYKKHIIDSNTFKCKELSSVSAIVTNYAEIDKNTFTNYGTVIRLVPTLLSENACQFDVSVKDDNTFTNANYLFSLVDVDDCFENENFAFVFFDSKSNKFSNVKNVGHFDVSTTNRYIESTITEWSNKSWNGITNKAVGVTLDEITMNLESAPAFDNVTLPSGERIKTYTEVEQLLEKRSGYTIKDKDDNLYYFYTTVNDEVNIFFKENTNDAYVSLLGDGDVESLKVKEIATQPNWLDDSIFEDEEAYNALKYFDITSEEKVGALYKLEDVFTTLNGNTFKNSELTQEDKYLRVSKLPVEIPEDPEAEVPEAKPSEVYISDIGEKTKLVLTNDTNPFITDATQLVVSLPSDSEVVLSGRYNVELQGTLKNLTLRDRLHVDILEGSEVTNRLEISGEKAFNAELMNYGTVEKLVVNSKANVTNFALVKQLVSGEVGERHIEETLSEASGASVDNNGTINVVKTYAKTDIFNFGGGHIEDLTVSYVEGYLDLCLGSNITNNGSMCYNDGNINLYVECKLVNLGIIGTESSRGYITIGDHGNSSAHDGVVITNAGIIWAGVDDESNTRLFVIYGVNEDKGESSPQIRIVNNHTIRGVTTYDEAIYVGASDIAPTLDITLNL